jgi:surfeit locus 1 family protein
MAVSGSARVWVGRLVPVVVAAAAMVMVSLGFWQLDRLQHRRAAVAETRAQISQAPLDLNQAGVVALPEYRPVQVRGVFDFAQEIVLRNRAHLGSPGAHVLTPLRITGSEHAVLINRGWIPYTRVEPGDRAAFQTPEGEVVVVGLTRRGQQRPLSFMPGDPALSADVPRLDAWFWLNLDQIQEQIPYPLLPFYIEAAPGDNTGQLPIPGHSVDLTEGSHLGYAIQWFSFAAILVGGSLAVWWQRRVGR